MASDDLTVAVLTPTGRGAVAVVAVDGADSAAIVERFFRPCSAPPLTERRINSIVYGRWGSNGTGTAAEDVIVCMRGNQSVEVHCHGGRAAINRIVGDLTSVGAQQYDWQSWIGRHERGTIRAAARTALSQAVTLRTAAILLDQYHGALETAIAEICKALDAASPPPAVSLPLHERERANVVAAAQPTEIECSLKQIETLISRGLVGLHLVHPWRVVVAGAPNVGKSSLVNALLGFRRSIVFDQPGTTRDAVTTLTALDGWPATIIDTAGWRESDDLLEAAGVRIAKQQATTADCLLLVFDASQLETDEHVQMIEQLRPAIVVHNKIDLAPTNRRELAAPDVKVISTSALTGEGIDALSAAIIGEIAAVKLQPGDAVPFTQEQVKQLELAAAALRVGNIAAAKAQLLALLA